MNRGSDTPSLNRQALSGRSRYGFNEAPIHESGKSAGHRSAGVEKSSYDSLQ